MRTWQEPERLTRPSLRKRPRQARERRARNPEMAPSWFEDLMGFQELPYEETRRNLEVVGEDAPVQDQQPVVRDR